MAKYHGKVGFAIPYEKEPGIVIDKIIERFYYGEVIELSRHSQSSGDVNDNLRLNAKISFLMDPFACENYFAIRYVERGGVKWKVTDVTPAYPRLTVTLGGVYNASRESIKAPL